MNLILVFGILDYCFPKYIPFVLSFPFLGFVSRKQLFEILLKDTNFHMNFKLGCYFFGKDDWKLDFIGTCKRLMKKCILQCFNSSPETTETCLELWLVSTHSLVFFRFFNTHCSNLLQSQVLM